MHRAVRKLESLGILRPGARFAFMTFSPSFNNPCGSISGQRSFVTAANLMNGLYSSPTDVIRRVVSVWAHSRVVPIPQNGSTRVSSLVAPTYLDNKVSRRCPEYPSLNRNQR